MKTPIGSIAAVFEFTETPDGLRGVAVAGGISSEMRELHVHEDGRVTWSQSVTRPLRLELDFDVVVDGDGLAGTSRAGRLPRSAVTAVRRG